MKTILSIYRKTENVILKLILFVIMMFISFCVGAALFALTVDEKDVKAYKALLKQIRL